MLSVTIRKESTEMISTLRDCGVQSVLLTGDNENSANSIAKQLGISEVYLALKTAHSASRAEFGFSPQNEVPPPPKGGGGYHFSWVGRVGFVPSKLGHAGSTGLTLFLTGVVPLPGLQNRTQGHTGSSLVLTVFSWGALGLVALPNLVPACKLSPPGWAGW